jgi:phenylacetic acid degradation operon negative regulatory protein
LALRGFAALQPALHIRPNNLRGGLAAERTHLAALGLSPHALVFRLADLDEARQAAAGDFWPNSPAASGSCVPSTRAPLRVNRCCWDAR